MKTITAKSIHRHLTLATLTLRDAALQGYAHAHVYASDDDERGMPLAEAAGIAIGCYSRALTTTGDKRRELVASGHRWSDIVDHASGVCFFWRQRVERAQFDAIVKANGGYAFRAKVSSAALS